MLEISCHVIFAAHEVPPSCYRLNSHTVTDEQNDILCSLFGLCKARFISSDTTLRQNSVFFSSIGKVFLTVLSETFQVESKIINSHCATNTTGSAFVLPQLISKNFFKIFSFLMWKEQQFELVFSFDHLFIFAVKN